MDLDRVLEDVFGPEWNDHNMRRDRPYLGQPHTTTGERGKTEVRGVTFRDLRDCFIRAVCLSTGPGPLYNQAVRGENAVLCENDLYSITWNNLDPMAVCRNLCCEVERIMGIFPNVPELKEK